MNTLLSSILIIIFWVAIWDSTEIIVGDLAGDSDRYKLFLYAIIATISFYLIQYFKLTNSLI